MLIGYVRVSTIEQNEARQVASLKERNVDKLFIDKASGKDTQRQALKEMLAFVRNGDTVITESISRIARSTRDLLSIIDTLTQKKVEFISLKESIDTTTAQGRFMLTVWQSWNGKTFCKGKKRESPLQRRQESIKANRR